MRSEKGKNKKDENRIIGSAKEAGLYLLTEPLREE
jgi:hypothetical protein